MPLNGIGRLTTGQNRLLPIWKKAGFLCFNRFYDAYGEFLQALFITQRVYPIAYDKWIREQVVEILGMPYLYEILPHLFEIQHFESLEIVEKAQVLRGLVEEFTPLIHFFRGEKLRFSPLKVIALFTYQTRSA